MLIVIGVIVALIVDAIKKSAEAKAEALKVQALATAGNMQLSAVNPGALSSIVTAIAGIFTGGAASAATKKK